MKVEVIMPQMGESIVEGTVVSWLKKPGDSVKRDEDIFTISTDKVDADIPSPAEGVLQEVLVEVGDTVEVGSVVAYIETEGSAANGKAGEANGKDASAEASDAAGDDDGQRKGKARAKADEKKADAQKADKKKADKRADKEADEKAAGSDDSDEDDVADAGETEQDSAGASDDVDDLRRTRSTPIVRKIAREHGISDLSKVPGTGISGRVTKNDILAYVARKQEQSEEAESARGAAPRRSEAAEAPAQAPAAHRAPKVHVWDDDVVEPMSRMRKSIAQHMVMSRAVSAHAQSIWDCEWTRAMKAYKALKPKFAERGVRLTVTALLVEAAVHALRAVPIVNSSLDGDELVRRNRINIGVAVAVPDGLIVPVVKNADELSLQGIARAVNDVAERAREKKLKPDDVEGGTFTISNPGVYGSRFGIPIISQPQVAILGVGAVKKRVVANEDDSIRVASMNTMCLSFDHRVVDGAQADQFMAAYVGFIEQYEADG